MVAIALMGVIAAIGVPAINGLLDLKQRAAAKELTQTYTWLLDEAALRNVAFRVVFNLDRRTWSIERATPTLWCSPTLKNGKNSTRKSKTT
jgi:type II secretory pathway pseudopilin PulG